MYFANYLNNPKKILFAPLDWGMGHASRCIPLIRECIDAGYQVVIAGNQAVNTLLLQEFPQLQYLTLQGYNVKYGGAKWTLSLSILRQIPHILSVIRFERAWLDRLIDELQIDMVISDNRYGLYSNKIPCVFITHQLQIQVPQSKWLQAIINRINHRYINQFTTCLVPDYEGENMSGRLSAKDGLANIAYIGNLSRFEIQTVQEKVYDLIVVLSGPEPQRSILEQKLMTDIEKSRYKTLIVRGKPGSCAPLPTAENITIRNHLGAFELQQAILQSEILLCRSGYSSVMDLIKLNRHAILIPTPGQTEQEYLGDYLMKKKWFVCCQQKDLSLDKLIGTYRSFRFAAFPSWNLHRYQEKFKNLLLQL